jgi:hypothetical protein
LGILGILGNFGIFWNFENFLESFGNFWNFWEFWEFLGIFGNFGKFWDFFWGGAYYALQITFRLGPVEMSTFLSIYTPMAEISTQNNKKLTISTGPSRIVICNAF